MNLIDLQDHLFEMIDDIKKSDNLKEEELDTKIKKALTINQLARTIVANGALMVHAADALSGLDILNGLPLIPAGSTNVSKTTPETKQLTAGRKPLIDMSRKK